MARAVKIPAGHRDRLVRPELSQQLPRLLAFTGDGERQRVFGRTRTKRPCQTADFLADLIKKRLQILLRIVAFNRTGQLICLSWEPVPKLVDAFAKSSIVIHSLPTFGL